MSAAADHPDRPTSHAGAPAAAALGPAPDAPAAAPLYDPAPDPVRAVHPRRRPRRRIASWVVTILSNAPLLLLLLLPLAGAYVEGPYKIEDPRDTAAYHVDPTRLQVLQEIGIAITLAVSLHLINGVSGQFSLGHAGFMAVGAYLSAYATTRYAQNYTASPGVLLYFACLAIVLAIAAAGLAVLYLLVRSTVRVARSLPGLLVLLLFAWLIYDLILPGTGSRPDLGKLVSGGRWSHEYTPVWPALAGKLSGLFAQMLQYGAKPLTFAIALLGGGLAAAAAGLLVGLPTLRLRGDYLAIVTLGFGLILVNLIELTPALGEATGLLGIPTYNARAEDDEGFLYRTHTIFPWIFGTAIVTIFAVHRLTRSPIGRAILATREDEVAAAAAGIGTTRYKVLAFVVGAFFAGVAGGLFAHFTPGRSIGPRNFEWDRSVEIVVMVTLGGLGNLWGAVAAAILLTFLPPFLQQPPFWIEWALGPVRPADAGPITFPGWLSRTFAWMAEYRLVVYAVLLILFMLARAIVLAVLGVIFGVLVGLASWYLAARLGPPRGLPSWAAPVIGASAGLLVGGLPLLLRFRRRRRSADAPAVTVNVRHLAPAASPGSSPAPAAPRGPSVGPPLLSLDRVSLRFGGLRALTDFSFALDRGELVGLIGPNGAGKTSAFNVTTGVYRPSGGSITLDGRPIAGLPPHQINHAGIARTFQNIRLFANLSVLDNVITAFNQSAQHGLLATVLRNPSFVRERRREFHDRAIGLLDTLGLAKRAKARAGSLPYGDQRRLEIARALATDPKILLLDEPAAGMNPQEKVELMHLIRFIRDHFGVGIWLIEHDMKLVMSVCERLTVLDHGETIAVGTPAQIQADPKVIEAYLGEPA